VATVETSSRGFERERKDRRDAHREGTVRDSRQDDSRDPHDNYLRASRLWVRSRAQSRGMFRRQARRALDLVTRRAADIPIRPRARR